MLFALANTTSGYRPLLEDPVGFLEAKKVGNYLDLATAFIFFYDYFITLPLEIQYIWRRPWTKVTTLWVFIRYCTLLNGLINPLYHNFSETPSAGNCRMSWHLQTWTIIVVIAVGEVLLIFRTCAIWENSKNVALGLGGLFFATVVAAVYGAIKLLMELEFITISNLANQGCIVTKFGPQGVIPYIVLLFYETVILFVTLAKASKQRGGDRRAIYNAIYRDGLLYYIWLLVVSIGNITAFFTLPGTNASHLTVFHAVMHSLLTSRLVLNIRRAVATGRDFYSINHEVGSVVQQHQ